jgi:5-methylcytosine-specific restriction endonuclease McrA
MGKKSEKGPARTPRIIEVIYHRDKGRCFWCGAEVKCPWTNMISNGSLPPDHGTRDHILPKSKGGPRDAYNQVLSCNRCNNRKGNSLINPYTGQAICPTVLWIFLKEVRACGA